MVLYNQEEFSEIIRLAVSFLVICGNSFDKFTQKHSKCSRDVESRNPFNRNLLILPLKRISYK